MPISDEKLSELLDKQAIYEVLARYARGIDRVDRDLIASCYHADGFDDHGFFKGLGHVFADRPGRSGPENKGSHHAMCQSMIDLHGDTAFCETYFVAHRIFTRGADGDRFEEMTGRYIDRFERRAGEWKIAFRKVVMDVTSDRAVPDEAMNATLYERGKRRPDDLVYCPEKLAVSP